MFSNLREYIEVLKKEKELAIIAAPVDPYLELAEIHRRVIAEEGPALLFTNVKGSPYPVITNMFGTLRRVELAFGPRPEQLVRRIAGAMDALLPPTPKKLWGERGLLMDMARIGLKRVAKSKSPVMAAYSDREPLNGLPVLTCWQEDGGPFITLPLVYTEHPGNRQHNLGMYRVQIYDAQTTGIHWQIHKGGGFHYHEAEQSRRPLPVNIVLGGPPALIAAAIAPVPEQLPELLLASLIMGKKLPVTEDPHGVYPLIAEAEFAICGKVPPLVRRPEGPFGDHYGYYSLTHDFPVFEVSHMWRRKDAIYPATVVGKPKQEDYYLGDFLQRLLSPSFPLALPGVKALWTYAETGFHPLAAAVVRESYAREALGSAFRILGEGQLTLTKFLILTDQAVRLENFPELLEAVLERFHPDRDLFIFNRTAHDTLDYTGGRLNHGSKAVLMGLGNPIRKLPAVYEGPEISGVREIRAYCRGCLTVQGESYEREPDLAERLLADKREQLKEWPLVVIVDDADAAKGQTSFLWTVFTRFNPASDIHANHKYDRHHLSYDLPIVIDARMKPGYPDELFPREDIATRVEERWHELFVSSGE